MTESQPQNLNSHVDWQASNIYYKSGYFGKPTKQRECEPSMFQILTWNDQGSQKCKKQPIQDQCECQKGIENDKAEDNKISNQRVPFPNGKTENANRRVNSKGKQSQLNNNRIQRNEATHPQNQGTNVRSKSQPTRPKSAGPVQKRVKEYPSPQKLPQYAIGSAPQQPIEQSEQQKEKLIEKFKQTTRWIPNSAFTTYFGKPAFENYGRGNTKPTYGGLMYGNYLKTHNVQPHRGANSPKNIQSYNVALMKGQLAGPISPAPPKVSMKEGFSSINKNSGSNILQSTQIYQEQNRFSSLPIEIPNLYEAQKFGGKGVQKMSRYRLDKQNPSYC